MRIRYRKRTDIRNGGKEQKDEGYYGCGCDRNHVCHCFMRSCFKEKSRISAQFYAAWNNGCYINRIYQ